MFPLLPELTNRCLLKGEPWNEARQVEVSRRELGLAQ